nr:hypothetical protein [Mycoplasmopsis bovis]
MSLIKPTIPPTNGPKINPLILIGKPMKLILYVGIEMRGTNEAKTTKITTEIAISIPIKDIFLIVSLGKNEKFCHFLLIALSTLFICIPLF